MHFRSYSCVVFLKLCAFYSCVKICSLAPRFCLPISDMRHYLPDTLATDHSSIVSRSVILPLPIFISTTRIKAPCAHQTITQSCEGITRRATVTALQHNVCCGCQLTDDIQPSRLAQIAFIFSSASPASTLIVLQTNETLYPNRQAICHSSGLDSHFLVDYRQPSLCSWMCSNAEQRHGAPAGRQQSACVPHFPTLYRSTIQLSAILSIRHTRVAVCGDCMYHIIVSFPSFLMPFVVTLSLRRFNTL